MATIAQILPRRWPGAIWSIQGDDYSTLAWNVASPQVKPTEAEVRAESASVDTEIAAEQRLERQQDALQSDSRDAYLKAIERLTFAVNDIQDKLKANALSAPLDATATAQIDALQTRLQQIRALT